MRRRRRERRRRVRRNEQAGMHTITKLDDFHGKLIEFLGNKENLASVCNIQIYSDKRLQGYSRKPSSQSLAKD
jgi:hypothetical protein